MSSRTGNWRDGPISDSDNLWTLVEERADATPDDTMMVSAQGPTMTFGEFRNAALVAAAGMAARGVRAGEVVSWVLPTRVEAVVLSAALSRLGVVQNPIIAIYRDREVGFCTRQAGSSLLITPDHFGNFDYAAMGARLTADNGALDHLVIGPDGLPEGDPATLDPYVAPGPEDVRWLMYTSGTTADPKGARHTDQTIAATARPLAERFDVQAGDNYALVFPFPHIGGIVLLCMGLASGCTHLLDEAFVPSRTIDFLSDHGCTHAGTGTPFHLMYLTAQAERDTPLFERLKCCPGGGAPKPPALHYRIKEELGGAGIVAGYGLTETPNLTTATTRDPDQKLADTEGRGNPGVQLRVVRPDGSVGGPGDEGELRAKAPQMMLGYVDESLDADAFDEDGWFRTGDLAILDEDGYVTITGRLKDVIIRNGENVSAKEIEDLLFTHDAVADVSVVGLPHPRTGEQVCAVVVLDGDASLDLDDIRTFTSEHGVRRQATPERLEIVDELPRNPAGKVLKRELQQRFGDHDG